jgi:hypothetical protein
VLPRDGNYSFAAIIHDYLYWVQDRSRHEADEIFKLAMQDLAISRPTIDIIYWAVRSPFGESAWNGLAAEKKAGGRRILKEFPDDPRTTWDEFKKKPGVFK